LSSLVAASKQELAAALTLLSPFSPLLFMGEEWGAQAPFAFFIDHAEPELQKAVSNGRKREFAEFGWPSRTTFDPNDPATFERSQLDWADLGSSTSQTRLAWYRTLIELRRTHPDLTSDDLTRVRVEYSEETSCLALWRGRVGVLCNFGATSVELELPPSRMLLGGENLTGSGSGTMLRAGSCAVVEAE